MVVPWDSVRGCAGSKGKDYRAVPGMTRRGVNRSRHTIAVLGHDVLKLWRQKLFRLGVFQKQDLFHPSATASPTKPPATFPGLQTKINKSRQKNIKESKGKNDDKPNPHTQKITPNSPCHTRPDTPSTYSPTTQKPAAASSSAPSPWQCPTTSYAHH